MHHWGGGGGGGGGGITLHGGRTAQTIRFTSCAQEKVK